ncbi:hypothetical protein M5K25_009024 [Dendrobium thyrsiflorum]|uniref:CCHC-type domain-containing protein n=1 Tax=Dendrobium thyrsiflorum TaxID=117978 RepID=A0ABD0VBV0_DENTH
MPLGGDLVSPPPSVLGRGVPDGRTLASSDRGECSAPVALPAASCSSPGASSGLQPLLMKVSPSDLSSPVCSESSCTESSQDAVMVDSGFSSDCPPMVGFAPSVQSLSAPPAAAPRDLIMLSADSDQSSSEFCSSDSESSSPSMQGHVSKPAACLSPSGVASPYLPDGTTVPLGPLAIPGPVNRTAGSASPLGSNPAAPSDSSPSLPFPKEHILSQGGVLPSVPSPQRDTMMTDALFGSSPSSSASASRSFSIPPSSPGRCRVPAGGAPGAGPSRSSASATPPQGSPPRSTTPILPRGTHSASPTAPPSPQSTGSPLAEPPVWNKVQFTPLTPMDKAPFTDEDGFSLLPAAEALDDNVAKLERALVAQLVGRRLPFAFLQAELRRQWTHFGEFQIITTAPSAFICIFSSAAARDAVLQGGPWLIGGSLLGMVRWTSDYVPNSLAGLHSSVWVRLPQLPLLYWDVTNLNRMANFIGEPLWLDSHTSTWGRSSFARMCVRLDLSKPLLPGIWIKGLHGRFFQRIEYEGLSNFCFACGMIGHTVDRCPSEWVNPLLPPPFPLLTRRLRFALRRTLLLGSRRLDLPLRLDLKLRKLPPRVRAPLPLLSLEIGILLSGRSAPRKRLPRWQRPLLRVFPLRGYL